MVPNPTNQNAASWQVADGMAVYATGGEQVGVVRNFDPTAEYFDVQKGRLFHKDFYVTMQDVAMVSANGIVLRLTKQDLDDDRYASPPTGGVAYAEAVVTGDPGPTPKKDPMEGAHEEVTVLSTAESGTGF